MHLTNLITDDDPDAIAITETWLDNTVNNTEFTPDGYAAFRKDRDINHYNPGTYTQNERGKTSSKIFIILSYTPRPMLMPR